jgi:hypothetical protein
LIEEERNTNIKVLERRNTGSIRAHLFLITSLDIKYTKISVPKDVRMLDILRRITGSKLKVASFKFSILPFSQRER